MKHSPRRATHDLTNKTGGGIKNNSSMSSIYNKKLPIYVVHEAAHLRTMSGNLFLKMSDLGTWGSLERCGCNRARDFPIRKEALMRKVCAPGQSPKAESLCSVVFW